MEAKDKKKHILEAAEDLFARKGFEASTVRDIADAAGVNLAMISYYFGSKEKLMETLFSERMDNMKLKIESLIKNKELTPFQKVETLLEEYVDKVVDKQAFYKILLCEQVMKKNPVIIRVIRELKLNYAALFSELIKEGQRKKVFKKNIDVVLAHSTMTGTVTQLVINKEFYLEFSGLQHLNEAEANNNIKEKLKKHLKNIFKSILGYES